MLILSECLRIAHDKHKVLGTCDSHIHATCIDQEPETALECGGGVRPDTADHYDILLSPLESVHCVHFNEVVQPWLRGREGSYPVTYQIFD